MTRTRATGTALAEGAAVHVTITAAGLAGLVLWARMCDIRKRRARRIR